MERERRISGGCLRPHAEPGFDSPTGFGRQTCSPLSRPLTIARTAAIGWILRVTTALLLIGHGGFDFAMGKNWTSYAAAVGVSPTAVAAHPLSPMAESFECVLGLIVLAWPIRGVLLFVFAWQLATEAFRPLASEPIWEFIERSGSYGAPLALAWLQSCPEEPARAAHVKSLAG
jgi:hypothetical protein